MLPYACKLGLAACLAPSLYGSKELKDRLWRVRSLCEPHRSFKTARWVLPAVANRHRPPSAPPLLASSHSPGDSFLHPLLPSQMLPLPFTHICRCTQSLTHTPTSSLPFPSSPLLPPVPRSNVATDNLVVLRCSRVSLGAYAHRFPFPSHPLPASPPSPAAMSPPTILCRALWISG